MATTLLQAPVGAGKTEIALQELVSVIHDAQRPFAKAWVLLATKRQETAFRQRLIERDTHKYIHFNVEFFNFYELNARLLNMAGRPPRRINQGARYGLLRHIIADLKARGELEAFASIAHTSGFVRIVADFIYELKQNLVYPDTFLQAAQTSKDHALAQIYAAYQALVQQYDLVDREGEGWLALAVLEDRPELAQEVALLLVDGYDQFTPVQAKMLAQLSQQVGAVKITLTDISQRDVQNFGGRFRQAMRRLQEAHQALGVPLEIMAVGGVVVERHPDLAHLEDGLFRTDSAAIPASGGVHLIEAPDPAQEMAAVLRQVRRLLLEGVPPDEIVIILRDWGRYQRHAETYQRLYQLPLLLLYDEALAENPAIAILLQVLELSAADFPRERLLDCLRSPYIHAEGLGPQQVDWLDAISRAFKVLGGRDQWLDAIQLAQKDYDDEDGVAMTPLLTPQQADQLSLHLETFFDFVTPKAHDTLEAYVSWIEMLIGDEPVSDPDDKEDGEEDAPLLRPDETYSLHLATRIREPQTLEAVVRRDLSALHRLKGILRGFLATQELLRATIGEVPSVTWEDFYSDLTASIKDAGDSQANPARFGKVLVTSASDARGLPHQHVFILGLAEGIFPARLAEDPLYLDNERAALSERGVFLQTLAERADDSGLFYELVSLPRQSLTLSRPTIQEGTPWIASYLWRAVVQLFAEEAPVPIRQYRVSQIVPYSEIAVLGDALLNLADGLSRGSQTREDEALRRWVATHPEAGPLWHHARTAQLVEARRLSRQPHDRYSGRIEHPALVGAIRERLGGVYLWSASQFNDLADCGFRFFAKRLLKLEAIEEPELGLDALQLGSLNHRILERTYDELSDMAIVPEHLEQALDVLHSVMDEELARAPQEYGFRASSLWPQEQVIIRHRLEALVRQDFEDSPLSKIAGDKQRFVGRQEVPFGMKGAPELVIDWGEGDEPLRVRGSIDRMDWVGDEAIIVDYKTGSASPGLADMREGRNFQMLVYLLAARQILAERGQRVKDGMFWQIRTLKTSGNISAEGDIFQSDAVKQALEHLKRHIRAARGGDFAVAPPQMDNRRCVRYCEFYQLCRVNMTHRHKREV